MVDLVIEAHTPDPRSDFLKLAKMLELDHTIKDGSEKGLLNLDATDGVYTLNLFGDKKPPIQITRDNIKFAGISRILSNIMPYINQLDGRISMVEVQVPTDMADLGVMLDNIVTDLIAGRRRESFQFTGADFRYLAKQLEKLAVCPNLGLLDYTHNQVPFQSAKFVDLAAPQNHVRGGIKDISEFFGLVRGLREEPLKEILRETYVRDLDYIIDGKEIDRALAYMASDAMGPITKSAGLTSLGWFNNPGMGLSYQLTTGVRAMCNLISTGYDTAEKMDRFLEQYHDEAVGTETVKWEPEMHRMHAVLSQDKEFMTVLAMRDDAPSAIPMPDKGQTIHIRRVHYPPFHTSPQIMQRQFDRMADLGLIRSVPQNNSDYTRYVLNEAD